MKPTASFLDPNMMDRRRRKSTKYFLNLEEKNYLNKLISTLEVDGKQMTDPRIISQTQTSFYKKTPIFQPIK